PVRNIHRAVGSLLSGELARRPGSEALLEGTITVRLTGTAGQSLGAFLVRGVTLELEGDANDYVGKGLSGGRISIRPPSRSQFRADENVIIGNTALYGATAGELFVAGQAGERFAVRNSGAQAVVEGVGDHGCEYMTGGVVVVLGQTGRNFAAGMSGGMAFVFDRDRVFRERCNRDQVELESLVDEEDMGLVHGLLEDHVRCTDSELGRSVLATWQQAVPRFVKIMPREYKRVLQAQRALRVPLRPPPDQWRA
ncbi:MAG: glutamate synthase subunit alpha, partial [Deltaproteobacteria bacterium]|nr:glutamate synthase subunit alpha [Deltaproteobacteria bacterium]